MSHSSRPPAADGFRAGTLKPSLHDQSFSQSYGSILLTSLSYIVPLASGCSPWRHDVVMSMIGCGRVTPSFKIKTRCSANVCPGSSCHTYGQNVNTETQCLYYINFYYTGYCLYTEDYIDSLIEQQQNNPTPQAIDRGQHKLLEEIFNVVVPLIYVF
jgi:hypothetical protein